MTTVQTSGQQTEKVERAERPAQVILKELAREHPDMVRGVIKHVIAELAMAGEMGRLAGFARLAKELFPAPAPERKTVEVPPGKAQLELPVSEAKPKAKKPEPEEEEVEEEEVEEEEVEEEEEEDEEEETPAPAFDPVKGKKSKKGKK